MNRTSILALVVLIGLVIVGLLYVNSGTERVADMSTERQFGYAEVDHIQTIRIADRKGHDVTLERAGAEAWTVDGRYPANENAMKNLLQAIRTLDIQSLPASAAVPNYIRSLATNGILVQLFDRGGRKLRGYYIGGGDINETGTVAIVEGSENPYIVHIPMWTGNARYRFNLWGDEWRSKVVFEVNPSEIEYLSIDYPKQQAKSFKLTAEGSRYFVEPLYNTGQARREVSRGAAERLLARYEKTYLSRYENDDLQSITEARARLPFATIRLKTRGKDEQVLQIFPKFDQGFTSNTETGEFYQLNDLQSYRGFLNGGEDWALFAPEQIDPLLFAYDSF